MSRPVHDQIRAGAISWESDREAAYAGLRAANERGVTGADLDVFTARMDASERAMAALCTSCGVKGARHVMAGDDGSVWVLTTSGHSRRLPRQGSRP